MIWMLANIEGKLLLTTSNRSEGDVGYTTMDGDSSGSLAPIAGVDKPFIRHILRWAEKELDYPALRFINALAPTAELRPPHQFQSDESDLMPYEVLLALERKAIPERKSPLQVFQEMSTEWNLPPTDLKSYVKKFYRLWSRNQWKRERTAPSFHLDDFNIDPKTWYRFPILSAGFEQELRELEGL
jgi:NAD+ synthase (glutamine-hydrolysing)